jgi:hypothetical protein
MKYSLSIADSKRYIVCRVHTSIDSSLALELARGVEQFSQETRIRSRLIDVRGMRNLESVGANYDLAFDKLQNIGLDLHAQAAILTDVDDNSHDFAETVLRNAGINVRKFTDEAAAIRWLTE